MPTDETASPDRIEDTSRRQVSSYAEYFESSARDVASRLSAFPRFVDRTHLARFLVRYEIFKHILDVQGDVIEGGVYDGGGTFGFAQISSILEPLNHRRHIVGFDTFSGFPHVAETDRRGGSREAREGGYTGSPLPELEAGLALFDRDRALGQIPKVQLVQGDFLVTGPRYLEHNPHLIVALLYLDFDLAKPTAKALELFLPRMPAGAVVAFDEVHVANFPGETEAMLANLDIRRLRLQRLPFTSICWAQLSGAE